MLHPENLWLRCRPLVLARHCILCGTLFFWFRGPWLAFPLTQKWRKQANGADVEAFARPEQMYEGLLNDNSLKRNRDIRGKFRDRDRDQQTQRHRERETRSLGSNQVFCDG